MSTTALLVLATEAAEGVETSKTLFYVTGGLLALWAVLVAAVGLARPDFPGSDRTARSVCGLSVLLMLAAMAGAVVTG